MADLILDTEVVSAMQQSFAMSRQQAVEAINTGELSPEEHDDLEWFVEQLDSAIEIFAALDMEQGERVH